MTTPFDRNLCVPPDVLVRRLDDESVLLHLQRERYYGLDEVGTRMLDALCRSDSIDAAYRELIADYDVEPDRLRHDLEDLIDRLLQFGLLEVREG